MDVISLVMNVKRFMASEELKTSAMSAIAKETDTSEVQPTVMENIFISKFVLVYKLVFFFFFF